MHVWDFKQRLFGFLPMTHKEWIICDTCKKNLTIKDGYSEVYAKRSDPLMSDEVFCCGKLNDTHFCSKECLKKWERKVQRMQVQRMKLIENGFIHDENQTF